MSDFQADGRHRHVRSNPGSDRLLHRRKKIGEQIIEKVGRFEGEKSKCILIHMA